MSFEQPQSGEEKGPVFEGVMNSLDRAEVNKQEEESEEALNSLLKAVEERAEKDPDFKAKLEARLKDLN